MKISVIVTTYNRPDALKKVLDGLLDQTRLPDEIIIADDGSTDETRKMLQPFLNDSTLPIKHVWQEDKGFRASRIRNLAIKESRWEYLVLLDGDCIPERHFIEDHVRLAEKGFFYQGKRILVKKSDGNKFNHLIGNSKYRLISWILTNKLSNIHHIVRIPFFPSYTTSKLSGVRSCNFGVFRSDIDAVNGFNNDFEGWGREDTELVVRLFVYGLKRKENPFNAACFHLWHRENKRDFLERNDGILKQISSEKIYFCKSGLKEL